MTTVAELHHAAAPTAFSTSRENHGGSICARTNSNIGLATLIGRNMRMPWKTLSPVICITAAAMLLAGCQPPPTVEESLARCPALTREADADTAAFHAKSAIHKDYAEIFGSKGTLAALEDQLAGRPIPQTINRFEVLAKYAFEACRPVHGEAKCQGPVVAEFAAYQERAHKRMWEEARFKCFSRGA